MTTDITSSDIQATDAERAEINVELAAVYARKVAEAASDRDAAIRRARDMGASLRDLATATGLSHEGIRKICARSE